MSVDVKCPQCGSELEAPASAAGKAVKCPDCGARIEVPAGTGIRPRPARDDPEEAQEERRPRRRRVPDDDDDDDDDDDEDDRPRRRRDGYEDEGIATLIPYKNGKALAAYYVGVFSLIP